MRISWFGCLLCFVSLLGARGRKSFKSWTKVACGAECCLCKMTRYAMSLENVRYLWPEAARGVGSAFFSSMSMIWFREQGCE